jgi:hypothetical protein
LADFWRECDSKLDESQRDILLAAASQIATDSRVRIADAIAGPLDEMFPGSGPDKGIPEMLGSGSTLGDGQTKPGDDANEGSTQAAKFDDLTYKKSSSAELIKAMMRRMVAQEFLETGQNGTQDLPRSHQKIGNMEVIRLVTAKRQTTQMRRPVGASDKGQEVVHWDRLATDGHIFAKDRPGGTLLIDYSGSMQWDVEKLQAALRAMPALTIAIYFGDRGHGKLIVIAEKGRWAEIPSVPDMQRGNEVDIEALQWLASQKGPRLWLSDSQICGGQVDVIGREKAAELVTRTARQHQIKRAPDLDSAIAYLRVAGRRRVSGVLSAADPKFVDHRPGFGSMLRKVAGVPFIGAGVSYPVFGGGIGAKKPLNLGTLGL